MYVVQKKKSPHNPHGNDEIKMPAQYNHVPNVRDLCQRVSEELNSQEMIIKHTSQEQMQEQAHTSPTTFVLSTDDQSARS